MKLLKLGIGNAKLDNKTLTFDLPAGHSCPYAKDCAEKFDPKTKKLITHPDSKFRCFAVVSEMICPAAITKRWHNFNLIKKAKTIENISLLLTDSINSRQDLDKVTKVRIHTSGDFFNQNYFDAWLLVVKSMPDKIFYAYTKSLKFWVNRLNQIPKNLHLTASYGGKTDNLIKKHNLKSVEVVYSHEEAEQKELQIDHDDSHCYDRKCHKFALLIHGGQKADSEAMKAVMKLRQQGEMGYSRGNIGAGRIKVAV